MRSVSSGYMSPESPFRKSVRQGVAREFSGMERGTCEAGVSPARWQVEMDRRCVTYKVCNVYSGLLKRLVQLLTCLMVCLQLCGGYTGVLQAAAWAGMAIVYSQENGIAKGLRMTFDGDHPCGLCVAIAEMKEDAGKDPVPNRAPASDWLKSGKDFPFPQWVAADPPREADSELARFPELETAAGVRAESPPVPPPRTV
jgi:hypothetical protein